MVSKENIYNALDELVKVPSISGSENENLGAIKTYELIGRIKYFKDNEVNLKMIPVEKDNFNRQVVFAMLEAEEKTSDTIIITGHYDVVGVEEYGHLKNFAFDMKEITKRISELTLDDEAQKDLHSGEWIFGRGTSDMKYGIALCIELLRYFSEEEKINTNILFLGVPGEETNSEGMLQSVKTLYNLQYEKGYIFKALINLEAYVPNSEDSNEKRFIHVGSAGKVMPLFLCCGIGTHAGEHTFHGFDSNLMASKLHELLHHNADFCEESRGVWTPPPACLKMMDLKSTYSITTPICTASYYNIITLNLEVYDLINRLKEVALKAFSETIKIEKQRADNYMKLTNSKVNIIEVLPKVVMFNEIYSNVKESFQGDFDLYIRNLTTRSVQEGKEIQDIAIRVFKEVVDNYRDKTPMIVLGFIPPYYPDSYLNEKDKTVEKLFQAIDKIKQIAFEKYDETIEIKDFFMGLSDMCFTGVRKGYDYEELFNNILGINDFYDFPKKEISKINIPSIIFGPYGKDIHKCSERLSLNYNFNVLPYLFVDFIKSLDE
ncbi:MAG: M20/M25/M40 family metallo-hydrolase [Clostridium sp.]|uniref:M20/M25/M40 family metallo-hydrolase n=1 Tax=Clostridium sp. TaxID=1506 RepID=UPI00301ED47D